MAEICESIFIDEEFILDEIDGTAALLYAAKHNYPGIVLKLKGRGFDLNTTDDEGKTAVFHANKNQCMGVLCALIGCDAQFNLDEIDGKAVLFHAAKNDLDLVVLKLHWKGLDLNTTDDEGKTAVFHANKNQCMGVLCALIGCDAQFNLDEIDGKAVLFHAAKNDLDLVVLELHWKGLDLNTTDDEGKTAVFHANKNNSMGALCRLIGYDAQFNLDEINGKAVLFCAAENNFGEVVTPLSVAGLDLNTTDDEGKTAVFHANKNHSMDALCELIGCDAQFNLDEIDGKAVLFHAAKKDVLCVHQLHWKGLDLNTTDDEGKTAVFHANKNHSMGALCRLIGCDAQFNLDEIDGKAVLFHAAKKDVLCVHQLHWKGLDLNTTDDEGKTAVFHANKNHSVGALCELIGCGAQFNLDEIDGKTVLFCAAEYNFDEVVTPLSDAGLNLNTTDDEGKTAVFHANKNHSMDALCELIGCDAQFNLDEIDGKVVLFHAAKNELPLVVLKLHWKGLDLNTTDDEGKTAVFHANKNHSMDTLCELIGCDAQFNLDELDGKVVLFHAAKNDLPLVVLKLHWKGLDLNTTDDEGKTAVFHANKNHSMDALCELIGCDAQFNLDELDGKVVLFHAAKNDLPLVVLKLHWKGLDLNTTDDEGKTAVFHANKNNSMGALCRLIGCDAQFNLDEIDGKAVLFCAAEYNFDEVVKPLSDAGLNLNTTDDEGKTAVFHANKKHSMGALCELIGCGAQFNLDEIDGKAVLFHAAKDDLPLVVLELHWKGLDFNTTDDEGKTAVFHANKNHSMGALCELIAGGAQFNLDEIDGKATLFCAAEYNFGEALQPLSNAGLDLNTTDDEGKTAVFFADGEILDALIVNYEFSANSRDRYGRTPLFYAVRECNATKARNLIKNGGNILLKDSCNVSMFSFFVENCIVTNSNVESMLRKSTEIFQKPQQLKALALATLDILYCQAPLSVLSDNGSPHLPKPNIFFNKTNVLDVLTFARDRCSSQYGKMAIDKITSLINAGQNMIDVPSILFLLNKLGANPMAADSNGNTALHYVTILPLLGVTQVTVMSICKKLKEFGAIFSVKNHQRQSPLLFCLSSDIWKDVCRNNKWQSIRGLEEVCKFLLSNGCSINDTSQNGESVFHRIILLIHQSLRELNDEASIKDVSRVFIEVLKVLTSTNEAVNNTDNQLNSPLHLWASIALKSPQDYARCETEDYKTSFEDILQKTLRHLLKCGAILNPRNANEETPLHLCKTWTAVKLLLGAGATPNNVDSSECSPLLAAAKLKNVRLKLEYFYPDVTEDPEAFWRSALEKGLDPWTADKRGESVLSVLIQSGLFILARALVEVACKENYATNEVKLSFLNVIYKDKSGHTHWKTKLGEVILESANKSNLSLDSPLRLCCKNIKNEKPDSFQQNQKDEPSNGDGQPPSNKRRKDRSSKSEEEKEEPSNGDGQPPSKKRRKDRSSKSEEEKEEPSNGDGQPPSKKRRKDRSSKSEEEKEEPSNGDGQPPSTKRRKDRSSKSEEEKEEPKEEQVTNDSVHCKIAKQLLLYDSSSGKSCLDIAVGCPYLKDLLTKPIEINKSPIRIPWSAVSKKYNGILAKVARRQEFKMVDQIRYHTDPIGRGSFGDIFAGINEKDGREVAIKRILKSRMQQPQDKREISHLTALADCEQVVRYLSFFEDKEFSYIALELMEGNLQEYLNGSTTVATQSTLLCRDVVMGLKFLHEKKVIHRDLKPQNILYKRHPKHVCLKIADFGLSRTIDSVSTTVYGTNAAGTRCWIAPEVFKSKTNKVDKKCFDPASDMFSCGLILHYILSGQKHPFNPTNCANKSELQVAMETEANILNDRMEGWDNAISPEATHLLKRMLQSNEGNRPSAEDALEHPLFWSNAKKKDFLAAVGNQTEFQCPRSKRKLPLTLVETDLDLRFCTISRHGRWNGSGYLHMPNIYTSMIAGKGRKNYDTSSAVELVRFIRNVYEHYQEKTFKFVPVVTIEQLLFDDFVFLGYFPALVIEVYKAVTTHGWDQTREDIKSTMNKK